MATVTDAGQAAVHPPGEQLREHLRIDGASTPPPADGQQQHGDGRHVLAVFCHEGPHGAVGRFAAEAAEALAGRQIQVHLFSPETFELDSPAVHLHPVGSCGRDNLIEQVHEFTRRACNSFLRMFQGSSARITLMGHEWSAIPAISLLHGIKNIGAVLSLHSLERQRSGLDTGISQWIEQTELSGLREARAIIVHNPDTGEIVRNCLPQCSQRIIDVCPETPMAGFHFDLDPGEVKGRFQVGPVDPTVLYVGDLDERYGPNLLMKAMPAVLKYNGQARCIFVGDGDLLWPLRVHSRYLLLDHAIRLAGHLDERALYELIHAADVIVVPSRQATPWWPIEAGWAASRPVVATHQAAPLLTEHLHDCLLVQPNDHDLAAGIERVLSDRELAEAIARGGNAKLRQRYGENKLILQLEEAIGIEVPV